MKQLITYIVAALLMASLLLRSQPAPAQQTPARPDWRITKMPADQVICFALYTVYKGTLKLTAQLYQLDDDADRTVRLEVNRDGRWTQIAAAEVIEEGWTAPFRVENWDASRAVSYRVRHGERATFSGTIQRDPIDKDVITVFAFTGNSINPNHGGDIPKTDIVENIRRVKPDLLFFSGDQVYNHTEHFAAWLKFGRDFGSAIAHIPTITIPDDHDVGQANLWGAGGVVSHTRAGHDGGYAAPLDYVKMVERAQTSHLPDPYDPTPVARGIGVYYTQLTWGEISFAILEDRKFKSGPEGLVPRMGHRPDHVSRPDYDPASLDVAGAVLLGERQLKFLSDWGTDWQGAEMKCALSQTIFCGGAHIHGRVGGRLYVDLDSNGWPQTGRNKAIDALRRCFALHVAGDQHLATIFHHGIDNWRDANVSFCVPSIANLYLRWWDPLTPGKNREPGAPAYTGDFLDGLGNHVTCYAVANPSKGPNGGGKLTTRAAGFGVVKFNKPARTITLECWPRNVDITDPTSRQYPGWPRTIDQRDNYARPAAAYLPTLNVQGTTSPVVQVIDESTGQIVYTLRIAGTSYRPKVFHPGTYTVKIGEGDAIKTLRSIRSLPLDKEATLDVNF